MGIVDLGIAISLLEGDIMGEIVGVPIWTAILVLLVVYQIPALIAWYTDDPKWRLFLLLNLLLGWTIIGWLIIFTLVEYRYFDRKFSTKWPGVDQKLKRD